MPIFRRWPGLKWSRSAVAAGFLASCLAAHAEPPQPNAAPAVSPELNSRFLDADPTRWSGVFESHGREVFDQRVRILEATRIKPGMTVADVGAGTGLFTMLFARAVGPKGEVYAVDISPTFAAGIRQRAAAQGFGNVQVVVNNQKDTLLPEASTDLVFVCDTYHHFEYPRAMLDSIARALRPNGTLVVIDFRRVPGVSTPWILSHVRAGEDVVRREIEAAGFVLVAQEEFMRTNYMLRFRKAAAR